ncbi:MAG: ribosome biogenesis GTP-binding protein YihA/YsxC [Oscillospiraceae bacterium]|jgi:GTP-binding protein|nr:ribosome biogenesis GTP-binding protein YihA/YsxC [Oscillospiraceae bacterium]
MNPNLFAFEAAYGTAGQLPASDLPEVAFSGRSNVGKSSLINALLRRKSLARVSSVPGKTITVNFYRSGGPPEAAFRLADLPGYGYAKRSDGERKRWAALMEGYFQGGRRIALVIQLLDMRHTPSVDDRTMLEFLREKEIPFLAALTKADKLRKSEFGQRLTALTEALAPFGPVGVLPVSSVTQAGLDELTQCIERAVNA